MDMPSWQVCAPFVTLSAFAGSIFVVAGQFDQLVPPYMDEIFHIPQAQAYCQGRWSHWDSKITTPPGLYLPSAIAQRTFPSWDFCSTTSLRTTNAALLFSLPFLIFRILTHFRTAPYPPRVPNGGVKVRFLVPEDGLMIEAVVIACFPLAYFSGFVYYTDLASVCAVLACYDLSLQGRHYLAGFLGFLSLWVRQTNILWVAFVAGSALVAEFKSDFKPKRALGALHDPTLVNSRSVDVPTSLWSLTVGLLKDYSTLIRIGVPYVFVAFSFVTFLLINGGIVLGDKSSHVSSLHIPQLYYFSAFSAAFSFPLLLDRRALRYTAKKMFGSIWRVPMTILSAAVMIFSVKELTYAHPFVLSDNRHYVFYLWRRVFNAHWAVRYALVPGYMVAIRLLWQRLARSYTLTLLPTLFYLLALCGTLIPSPLIEPRYFLTPYILLRLHYRPLTNEYHGWQWRLFFEWLLYAMVNVVTLVVFLYRPWKAPEGMWEGEWQRFMW